MKIDGKTRAMKELCVKLDTHHINGSKRSRREKNCAHCGWKKGFINPLAYETQIVKRLNSLQPY